MIINVDFEEELRKIIRSEFSSIINEFNRNTNSSENKVMRSKDVRKLLNISDNTLRTLRNNRKIPFSLVRKTYYYNKDEILKYIQKNNRSPDG